MIDALYQTGSSLLGGAWPVAWTLIKIIVLVAPLMVCVAYLTLWERKAIGWTQIRPGPNRVGPYGLLTPIADAVKLIFKEIIVPAAANKSLFFLGPVMTIMPALAAWVVIPFGPEIALANINAGLLFLMAITSLEVYGVIIAGWASNSKYAFLGALRASAQMVSYEIPMGFALVIVLMVTGSLKSRPNNQAALAFKHAVSCSLFMDWVSMLAATIMLPTVCTPGVLRSALTTSVATANQAASPVRYRATWLCWMTWPRWWMMFANSTPICP